MKLLEEYNGVKVGDYIIGHERNIDLIIGQDQFITLSLLTKKEDLENIF